MFKTLIRPCLLEIQYLTTHCLKSRGQTWSGPENDILIPSGPLKSISGQLREIFDGRKYLPNFFSLNVAEGGGRGKGTRGKDTNRVIGLLRLERYRCPWDRFQRDGPINSCQLLISSWRKIKNVNICLISLRNTVICERAGHFVYLHYWSLKK